MSRASRRVRRHRLRSTVAGNGLRDASARPGTTDFSDTFNRARPVESVIHPGRLVRGLVRALTAPGADRKAILKELRAEVPMELSLRRRRFIDGFRSSPPTSTERAGPTVGEPNSPPSYRPAAPDVEGPPQGESEEQPSPTAPA